ncbi:MAG: putative DNA-binding domain-containing protein [Vampirovibrionales bacterium]|nr:putative DNA-binding domain-containing protein [Vampirovibrionales bacterium]
MSLKTPLTSQPQFTPPSTPATPDALDAYQATLGQLLLQPDAENALTSAEALSAFLENTATQVFSNETMPAEALAQVKHWLTQQPLNRLQQYRIMVRGNLNDTLKTIFPFSTTVLKTQWPQVFDRYLQAHPPQSYLLFECAAALPAYLATDSAAEPYPFLPELANIEYIEAKLLRAESRAETPESAQAPGEQRAESDTPAVRLTLNPVAQGIQCRWPVQGVVEAIKAEAPAAFFNAIKPEAACIWVFRDAQFKCRFFNVSPVIHAALILLQGAPTPVTLAQLTLQLTQLMQQANFKAHPPSEDDLAEALAPLQSAGLVITTLTR